MGRIVFGAAYYDEYMPTDRIDRDVELMRDAHVTTVRIAESTWSTLEPQPGVFDFTHVDRAIDAMEAAGIDVIVGTPTYAVPSWLTLSHPEVLAVTGRGEPRYGARQNMDITSPAYRFHAERVIRALMQHTAHRRAVVGFQVDNETKHYDVASLGAQRAFVKHLRVTFDDDLDALNARLGLDYWSNRIDAWEDVPDVRGTINGSLGAEFDAFRRRLVEEFLAWQAGIVREYAREDQFVTQNFDFDWAPGWSYGLQPAVDHFRAARAVDVAGVDIYHPTQDRLTGKEIAFGGDVTRSIKGGANYLVLETQAQGQPGWLPYPGQLRLQAFSHLASGANGVMYWHWHSIHHSFETYWKGVLSHDLEPNRTYREAAALGAELAAHGDRLTLRKRNRMAVMVSNESLTALRWFTLETGFIDGAFGPSATYNDVLRWVYDALFDLNVEVDVVPPDATDLDRYDVLVVPALYSAPESTLATLRAYVEDGGHLVTTARSAVANEFLEVWHDRQPHLLTDVLGLTYDEVTLPQGVELTLHGDLADAAADDPTATLDARVVMELLRPDGAEVLAEYAHHAWAGHAAVTRHRTGAGTAVHVGTVTSPGLLRALLRTVLRDAGLWGAAQDLAGTVTVRRGANPAGRPLTYLLNYSPVPVTFPSPVTGRSLLDGTGVTTDEDVTLGPWDLRVVEG